MTQTRNQPSHSVMATRTVSKGINAAFLTVQTFVGNYTDYRLQLRMTICSREN